MGVLFSPSINRSDFKLFSQSRHRAFHSGYYDVMFVHGERTGGHRLKFMDGLVRLEMLEKKLVDKKYCLWFRCSK